MTVTTRVIRILLSANTLPFVEIEPELRVQVLDDVKDLPQCQKHQSAAFLTNQGYLLVWDDDPKHILRRAEKMEMAVLRMIWGDESAYPEENQEKKECDGEPSHVDTDAEEQILEKPRRIVLMQSWLAAFTLVICLTGIGAGWREIAVEMAIDFNWRRLCFLLVIVPQFWLSLVCSPLHPSTTTDIRSSSSKLLSATSLKSLVLCDKSTETPNTSLAYHRAGSVVKTEYCHT